MIRQEIQNPHIGNLRDWNSYVDHREQCRRPHRSHSGFHVRDFMSCCMYHMLSSTRTVPRHQPFHYAGHNLPLLCQRPCTAFRMCSDDLTGLPIRMDLVGENLRWADSTQMMAPRWDNSVQGMTWTCTVGQWLTRLPMRKAFQPAQESIRLETGVLRHWAKTISPA